MVKVIVTVLGKSSSLILNKNTVHAIGIKLIVKSGQFKD